MTFSPLYLLPFKAGDVFLMMMYVYLPNAEIQIGRQRKPPTCRPSSITTGLITIICMFVDWDKNRLCMLKIKIGLTIRNPL